MTTIACVGIRPRSSITKSNSAWARCRREAAAAIVARPSSCPRRGRGVYVRLVARHLRLPEATAGRRRRLRRGRGHCCGVPRWPRREAVVAHYTTGFVRGCGNVRRRGDVRLYAIDAGGGVVADVDAWRDSPTIGCALWGASGPRHYKPYIRRALWFSNERRGDYRRLS